MNKSLILTIATLLTGCANMTEPVEIKRISFPESEYLSLPQSGSGKISGQVFLKTTGGEVKYGAGSKVWLNPKTSYSDQWYSIQQQNNFNIYGYGIKKLNNPNIRISDFVKETQADGFGYFNFDNVPPGLYYLSSGVIWQPIKGAPQGGLIVKIIKVVDDKEIEIMLTR